MFPLIADLGAPELLIILVIVILVFGASKLPELARGSGRALRIFKAETKGLRDDEEATPEPAKPELPPAGATPADDVAEGEIVEPRRDTTNG